MVDSFFLIPGHVLDLYFIVIIAHGVIQTSAIQDKMFRKVVVVVVVVQNQASLDRVTIQYITAHPDRVTKIRHFLVPYFFSLYKNYTIMYIQSSRIYVPTFIATTII